MFDEPWPNISPRSCSSRLTPKRKACFLSNQTDWKWLALKIHQMTPEDSSSILPIIPLPFTTWKSSNQSIKLMKTTSIRPAQAEMEPQIAPGVLGDCLESQPTPLWRYFHCYLKRSEITASKLSHPICPSYPTCRAYRAPPASGGDSMMVVVQRFRLKGLPAFPD